MASGSLVGEPVGSEEMIKPDIDVDAAFLCRKPDLPDEEKVCG